MILYDEECFWRDSHLCECCALYFTQEEWGTMKTCFYPSQTVKTRGFVGYGGGSRCCASLDSRVLVCFGGISFRVDVGYEAMDMYKLTFTYIYRCVLSSLWR